MGISVKWLKIISWVEKGGAAASASYGGSGCWSWTWTNGTCRVSSDHYAVLSRIIEISKK